MRGREQFRRYRALIDVIEKAYGALPRGIREKCFVRLRSKPGKLAMLKRYVLLRTLAKRVGENVAVFPDVYLQNIQELSVGDNVSFHPMVYIEAYGGVSIGDDVSIAEGASLFSVNHIYESLEVPIKDQGLEPLPIVVEDNVWIGAKATILGGVNAASGSIIAAGAVVTKDVPPNSIVAGVPARTIRNRG